MLQMIRLNGEPFAILSIPCDPGRLLRGEPAAAPEACYLLPPVVFDLAGNVIEGLEALVAITSAGIPAEIPVLYNKTPGDLAEIDQRLAALRDHFGARPRPPLDPRDDPAPR